MSFRKSISALAASLAASFATQGQAHPDTDNFVQSAFVTPPEVVSCRMENGDMAQCYEFTVAYQPEALEIGPFCPATLDDEGGLWAWDGENAGLYRLDRAFFEMLAALGYTFFDADEAVHIATPVGPRPTVAHACLSAKAEPEVTMTMRLPVNPVMAGTVTPLGTVANVGVALDGVPIFSDAPSVLDTGHLPALDLCGGHIDPGGWYHWHATATDIDTVTEKAGIASHCSLEQDATALFGYAFDGYALYGSREMDGSVPADLDACGGHVGSTLFGTVYHYHASETFPNLPACLVGVVARDNFSTTAEQGIGSPRDRGRGGPGGRQMPPGFAEAAHALGVAPRALAQAVAEAGGPRADLARVAAQLGVDEADLRAALPRPPDRGPERPMPTR